MGYVFISYSSKDIDYADTIKREFEKNGIKTWMAPGDIPAGTTYAGVIARALKEADGLVLLLTNHSQESIWVDKEVERALNYKKIIIPLALENVKLNDNFEFYLGNQQIVQVRVAQHCACNDWRLLCGCGKGGGEYGGGVLQGGSGLRCRLALRYLGAWVCAGGGYFPSDECHSRQRGGSEQHTPAEGAVVGGRVRCSQHGFQ